MAEPVWLDSVPLTVTVEVSGVAVRGVIPVMEIAIARVSARSVPG